jgi:hypothetical protein
MVSWVRLRCAAHRTKSTNSSISDACSIKFAFTRRVNCHQITAPIGKGFDEECVRFLCVGYDDLVEQTKQAATDEEILEWCFANRRKPSSNDTYVRNEFMRKRRLER